jgi:hypothetical protein
MALHPPTPSRGGGSIPNNQKGQSFDRYNAELQDSYFPNNVSSMSSTMNNKNNENIKEGNDTKYNNHYTPPNHNQIPIGGKSL